MESKSYWEQKILRWEKSRYGFWSSLNPASYTVQRRLRRASALLAALAEPGWRILELGCGSGFLPSLLQKYKPEYRGHYTGIDFAFPAIQRAQLRFADSGDRFRFQTADVRALTPSPAEITVFLGLSDWLAPQDFTALLGKIESSYLLFSYTEKKKQAPWNPYYWYRKQRDRHSIAANAYTEAEIKAALHSNGFTHTRIQGGLFFDPGHIVLAKRGEIQA